MSEILVHRAELIAMNLAIQVMGLTGRSSFLSTIFLKTYHLGRARNLALWMGLISASCAAGFLTGCISYFILPK